MNANLIALHNSLKSEPINRDFEDIQTIASFLQSIPIFQPLIVEELYQIGKSAKSATFEANTTLYKKGDKNSPWFLILSGSVLINNILFNQHQPFGYEVSNSRPYDCFIIDKLEVMVIYSTINWSRYDPSYSIKNHFTTPLIYSDVVTNNDDLMSLDRSSLNSIPSHSNENASSIVETSSLYSIAGSSNGFPDFTGLQESAVDSDEEDENWEQNEIFELTLQKDLADRTDEDIRIISERLSKYPCFEKISPSTVSQLASIMTFAVINVPNEVLLCDGEKLDSWTVILCGELELQSNNGTVETLKSGSCFGVEANDDEQFQRGFLRTKSDVCKFAIAAQEDYTRIINAKVDENTHSVVEKSQIVMVTQTRDLIGQEPTNVVIRATPDKLFMELLKEPQSDPTYIQDYLLTYRTFYKQPTLLADKLLTAFDYNQEKAIYILFDWIQMHFIDFENQPMSIFLDKMEKKLQTEMRSHLRRLHELLDSKARPRSLEITRVRKDDHPGFSALISERSDRSVFVEDVFLGSRAEEAGMKVGDQILEVNGQIFKNMTRARVDEILKGSTHLLITLKSNLIGFNDTIQANKKKTNSTKKKQKNNSQDGDRNMDVQPVIKARDNRNKLRAHDDGLIMPNSYSKFKNSLAKFILPKTYANNNSTESNKSTLVRGRLSASHPNLATTRLTVLESTPVDLDVLKIFRADQSYRFVKVDKETTANQAVMLAAVEFNISLDNRLVSTEYSLYEVSIQPQNDNCVKNKRLKDSTTNLMQRTSLYSRYYMKENASEDPLFPEEAIDELKNDWHHDLLSLDENEVACQLTLNGLDLFSRIQPSEYINDLFNLREDGKKSVSNLEAFSQLSNMEMFWVAYSICREQSLNSRVKIVKKFIQIARCCIDCQNFNSMFSIISGLGHQSVSRLKQTWDKLPTKYKQLFKNLQSYMNISDNMGKYRTTISKLNPPIIPFFPLIKKDLTFLDIGNKSVVDGLINFEKLRMVAKQIRLLYNMVLSQDNFIQNFNVENFELMWRHNFKIRLRGDLAATTPTPRQIYEADVMTKKVRAYLASRVNISNEEQLNEMSSCCEGSSLKKLDNISSSSTNLQKITPVSKFGVDSSDNVRKLISLSDKSRPFNPKKTINNNQSLPIPINSNQSKPGSINSHQSQSSSINGHQSQNSSINSHQSQPAVVIRSDPLNRNSSHMTSRKAGDNLSTKSASPHLNSHAMFFSSENSAGVAQSLSYGGQRPLVQQSRSLRESSQKLNNVDITTGDILPFLPPHPPFKKSFENHQNTSSLTNLKTSNQSPKIAPPRPMHPPTDPNKIVVLDKEKMNQNNQISPV